MNINILVADDHALVREGIKKVLKEERDFTVAAEAKNAQEVFDRLDEQRIDILLLDISMPGRSGIEALKKIKTDYPEMPVLILSMHPEDRFAIRALKSGASGYLTKESAPEELVLAIRKILTGGTYISSSLAERLAFEINVSNEMPAHTLLSDREFEVLRMIASGKTVSGIAEELFLSVPTVSTYRARILDKMKMKTNSELTYYAIHNQLID